MNSIISGNHYITPNKTNMIHRIVMSTCQGIIITVPSCNLANQLYSFYQNQNINQNKISVGILTEDVVNYEKKNKVIIMTNRCLLDWSLSRYDKRGFETTMIVFGDCSEITITREWEPIIMMHSEMRKDKDKDVQLIFLHFYANPATTKTFADWICRLYPNRKMTVDPVTKDSNHIHDVQLFTNKIKEKPFQFGNRTDDSFLESYKQDRKTYNVNNNSDVYIMHGLLRFLQKKKRMPVILINFSRQKIEDLAISLHTRNITSAPHPNILFFLDNVLKMEKYKDFLNLKEFQTIINLLYKKIAYYHSGLLQPIRELIEQCMMKGYIEILLSTDALPNGNHYKAKTIVYMHMQKYNGEKYEYISNPLYHKLNNAIQQLPNPNPNSNPNTNMRLPTIIYAIDFFHTIPTPLALAQFYTDTDNRPTFDKTAFFSNCDENILLSIIRLGNLTSFSNKCYDGARLMIDPSMSILKQLDHIDEYNGITHLGRIANDFTHKDSVSITRFIEVQKTLTVETFTSLLMDYFICVNDGTILLGGDIDIDGDGDIDGGKEEQEKKIKLPISSAVSFLLDTPPMKIKEMEQFCIDRKLYMCDVICIIRQIYIICNKLIKVYNTNTNNSDGHYNDKIAVFAEIVQIIENLYTVCNCR